MFIKKALCKSGHKWVNKYDTSLCNHLRSPHILSMLCEAGLPLQWKRTKTGVTADQLHTLTHIHMHHCSLVPEVDCCLCQEGSVMCLMPEVKTLSCLFSHRGLCVHAEDCNIQGRTVLQGRIGYCIVWQSILEIYWDFVKRILISNILIKSW